MNRFSKSSALFFILIIAISSLSLLMVESASAQVPTPPDVPTLGPIIICDQGNYLNVSSPQSRNYPNNPIQLTFTITVSTMLGQFGNVGYSIDSGVVTSIRNLPTTETRPDPYSGEWYYYTEKASANLDLPQLTDGAHNVTVYYGWQYLGVPQNPSLERFEVYAYQTVNFTIGTPQPTPSPSIPKPSVPEFSVRYFDNSYYASTPTTITDQYGNSRVEEGYVENKTVEFSIRNQAFTPYTNPYNSSDPYNTGQTVNLMFNIRMKSNLESNWTYITHLSDGYLIQSNSNFTTASYQLGYLFQSSIPHGSEVGFQVQALVGYVHRYPTIASWTFNGTESDWSNTKTIIIPASSSSTTPTIPELPSWTIPLLLTVMVASAGLLVYLKRKTKTT
jgi:hypothetical protein